MIVKPYEPRRASDRRLKAGIKAEKQMAFYLDRHFKDSDRFLLLHDLRLTHEGDNAQIDHLVVHPFGLAIIESKSVSSAVRINAQGEWERQHHGTWTGMPDPLLQAERQAKLLKRLLTAHEAELLDKLLGRLTGTFTLMAIDTFAAVSDEGRIVRADTGQAPKAKKADAIPKAIEDAVVQHRRDGNLLSGSLRAFMKAPRDFNAAERLRIARFLHAKHRPAEAAARADDPEGRDVELGLAHTEPVSGAAGNASVIHVSCRHCEAKQLEAKIGGYGPYGHCDACGKNTKISEKCRTCGTRYFLERDGAGFTGSCADCGSRLRIVLS